MTPILSRELAENAVYNPSKPWEDNVLKIIRLSEAMKKLDPQRVFDALERIKAYEDDLRRRVVEEGLGDEPVSREEKDRLIKLLDEHVSYAFDPDEFTKIADAAYLFWPKVDRNELKLFDLFGQFAGFRLVVHMELFSRLLLVLDPQRAPFYGREQPFGVGVAISFPSAEYEIREAGDCYALGRNTACVFHLMRILEKGLRALAKKLNVQCEVENWEAMIQNIESAIKRYKQVHKEPEKAEKIRKMRFYANCATEFGYFQHAWRNHVMHAQAEYGEKEAFEIMSHVEAFIRKLSEEITEF